MNPKQTRTSAPRLTAGCVLSVLLAASPACVGEDYELDPGDERDTLDDSSGSIAYADAGRGDAPSHYADAGKPDLGYADAGVAPGNASCEAEPGKPYADAGTEPSKPYVDAGGGPVVIRSCFSQLIGDGRTCLSDLDLKLQGYALCEAKGYTLDSLKLGEADCAGGSTEGWIACCELTPPEPAPVSSCTSGVIGDGSTCIDLTSVKLKASAACDALGASLVGLAGSSDDSCPGGSLWAKYECCKSDAPPKPSDPGKEPWLK